MDRASDTSNGSYVRWSTLIRGGVVVIAFLGPLIGAAIAWGNLSAKVDNLADAARQASERSQRMDEAINSLNVSVAKLSGAVEALTRRLPADGRGAP